MRSTGRLLVAMVILSVVTVGLGHSSLAETQHKVRVPRGFPVVDPIEEARAIYAYQQVVVWNALSDINAYFTAIQAQIDAERAQQEADRAEAARLAQVVQQARQPVSAPAGPGYPSEAFWREVARCEEGGNNDPRYGYFGKIDGAWAGLSWDEQVRRARDLWNSTIAAGRDISKVWTSYPSCTGPVF